MLDRTWVSSKYLRPGHSMGLFPPGGCKQTGKSRTKQQQGGRQGDGIHFLLYKVDVVNREIVAECTQSRQVDIDHQGAGKKAVGKIKIGMGGPRDERGSLREQDIVIGGVLAGSRLPEHWTTAGEPVDFYDIKGDVEAILALTGRMKEYRFVPATHPALHPGQCAVIRRQDRDIGWVGRVHPSLAEQYDLEPATCVFQLEFAALEEGRLAQFRSISRFPSIRRDLAVVVDEAIAVDELRAVVRSAAGELLQELVIFDVYQGKGIESGRKSIAFGLILQDSSRTLTDKDTEALVARVTQRLGDSIGATLRE